jgi:hypothetical protein
MATKKQQFVHAREFLEQAVQDQKNRASQRDVGEERTMGKCVTAFNAVYGTQLTEEMGWMFMVMLKIVRARGGSFHRDDYADGASYFSLAGEVASTERK